MTVLQTIFPNEIKIHWILTVFLSVCKYVIGCVLRDHYIAAVCYADDVLQAQSPSALRIMLNFAEFQCDDAKTQLFKFTRCRSASVGRGWPFESP